jgi:hypothetical protein
MGTYTHSFTIAPAESLENRRRRRTTFSAVKLPRLQQTDYAGKILLLICIRQFLFHKSSGAGPIPL